MPISAISSATPFQWPEFFSFGQLKKYSGYALTVLGAAGIVGSGILFFATTAALSAIAALVASIGMAVFGKYLIDTAPQSPTSLIAQNQADLAAKIAGIA